MTTPEWKKVARLLKEAYTQLEKEALSSDTDIFGEEFKKAQDVVRLAILEKMGFTIDEYRAVKLSLESAKKQKVDTALAQVNARVDALQSQPAPIIPTKGEITALAHEVAKEYIVPPVITNQIVKETTIEKPQILETVREITKVEKYDATAIEKKLVELKKQLSDLKIPAPYDDSKLKEYFHDYFSENIQHNIDTLGMPDFRKLAMGLQAQIDVLGATPVINDADIIFTDVTTNDVTSSKHGFAPKSTADTTEFLRGGPIPYFSAVSLDDIIFPPNNGVLRILAIGSEVGHAYSEAIEAVLNNPELSQWEYILTIESDNMPPADGVLKLLKDMDEHPEYSCIGGLYFCKGERGCAHIWGDPKDPVLNFRPLVPIPNQLVECCGSSMGFHLWRMKMFKDPKLTKPFFETKASAQGVGTQDLSFWSKARPLGYRTAVDCGVKVGHFDLSTDTVW